MLNRNHENIRIGVLKLGGVGDACDFCVILHGIRTQFPQASIVAISDGNKQILKNYADAVVIDKKHTWNEIFSGSVWKYNLFYDLRPHYGLVFKGDVYSKTHRFIANNSLGHLDERVPVVVTVKGINCYKHYNSMHTNKLQMLGKRVVELNCKAIGVQSNYDDARLSVPEKLTDTDFITINTGAMGAEKGRIQTKQWPYWQQVVDTLLEQGERVVHLGIRWEKKLKRVEHVWQKPLTEVIQYLEASKLHLGNENGLVRLRRLVTNKPSVVVFGPTHPDMYGFDNNINIWPNVCHPCLWYTGEWMYECANNLDCLCMKTITPQDVTKRIERIHDTT